MAEVLQTLDANAMPEKHGSPGKKKNTKGKRLSVERIYQKKTQREHILIRPDAYIGSVESETKNMWIWNDQMNNIAMKEITFCPGLYKIFDEILVNAADNKQRDPSMSTIKITINAEKNVISVWNNGKGIPIELHKEQNVYVPTLIFGQLLTSSNYDDTQKKVTGGRNGFGAKLCNIYSTKFIVETACSEYGKKFKQVWKGNMTKAEDPKIQDFRGTDFTCITFQPDLPKFHMEKLNNDMVALLKRRAYDVAGCSRGVSVYLNGEKLRVKSFKEYVDLYLKGIKRDEDEDGKTSKIVHEICNNRWEVCVTVSEGGFQQASFVNSIATTKGGSHVNYIVDQIASKMMTTVKKKAGKELNIKPFQIKNHIWVFINCLIENPTFDSQTKENMTLNQKSFGSNCELSEKFIKSVQSCGVLENIMNWVKFKAQEKLNSKCSGSKKNKIKGIPKLDDANDAGGPKSRDCTLILTEGDSAKTLAVSGIGIVGRDKYGVFPLRGKLLNVRDASSKQIMENAEVNNIVKIVGLQYKKKYTKSDDLKSLRYGRIMIMTDQDQDGSHIKGLLINFFHSNWPDILQLPFLEEFITPIVKVSKGTQSKSFFSLPELEEWKQQTANAKSWKVKYYKGLGTSTSKEAKEYFSDMQKHRIKFNYDGATCDQAIKMAFSKKMVSDRKNWLTHGMEERKTRRLMGMPEMYLYGKDTRAVSYSEFVNKELILFSNTDNERSIPSIVDGLKPGQRKVLFTCLKRNDKREIKVAQLAGSIAELSAYHHGEVSLMGTIINLAQNYLGSNNINLLQPIGQFGTRINGGKDSASPRYIFTMLSPVTRLIFPEQDDAVLKYLEDDGTKIEPEWYCPILPMVLVNGAEGIGTGWSTKIPNYNPRELVQNIKKLLAGESIEPMVPWYKNFTGTIQQVETQKYIASGQFDIVDGNTLEISELPVKTWTSSYKEGVLEPYLHGTEKTKACITDYRDCSTDKTVKFTIAMEENELARAEQEGISKRFKLESAINTSSMVLFDEAGALKKYEDVESILKDFYTVRLRKYNERMKYMKGKLQAEVTKLENQARFILEKIEGKISIENRSKRDVVSTLLEKGFLSDPVKTWKNNEMASRTDDESDSESVASDEGGADFNYILNMNLWSLSKEKKEELLALRDAKKDELFILMRKSPEDLWNEDLDAFLIQLDVVEEKEREEDLLLARSIGKSMNQKALKKPKKAATTAAIKKEKTTKVQTKTTAKEPKKQDSTTSDEVSIDDASSTTSSNMMSLKDRLASKASDPSSKIQSLLNFNPSKKRKPTKKLTVSFSDDDDDDDIGDFSLDDDDDDDDFIPKKRQKKQVEKEVSNHHDDDDDDDNSEIEKTQALIRKLSPVKEKKAAKSQASKKAKRNVLTDDDDDIVIDNEKSSPAAASKVSKKKPAKRTLPATTTTTKPARGKKFVKDANQMTLFAATKKTKLADKKTTTLSLSSDDDYDDDGGDKEGPIDSEMKPKRANKPASKHQPAKKATKKKALASSDEDEPVVVKKNSKPAATKAKKAFNYIDEDDNDDDDDDDDDDESLDKEIPAKTDRVSRNKTAKKAKYTFNDTDEDITFNDDDDDDDSDFSF